MTDSTTGWGALYAEHVDDLAALSTSLDDADLATTVPATPAWTVHDVLAHLAGVGADHVTGRTAGAPGPEWTSRQVAERHGLPLTDLVAELRSHVDHVAAALDGAGSPGVLLDTAVHHADLHEALGRHQLADHLWLPLLPTVAPQAVGDLPVTLVVGGATYGGGGPRVDVAPYELFRTLFSRRSRRQVQAWGTLALTPDELDGVCVFGPRDDDQPDGSPLPL